MGLENQAFGKGCIAKINFHRNSIYHDPRVHFLLFWVALGPIFITFVALETGSKIDTFSYDFECIPDPESRVGGRRLDGFLGTLNSPGDLRHEI